MNQKAHCKRANTIEKKNIYIYKNTDTQEKKKTIETRFIFTSRIVVDSSSASNI